MSYPRVLTVQDISCVGQCSLTVALPIISACGVETCVLFTGEAQASDLADTEFPPTYAFSNVRELLEQCEHGNL